MENPTDCGKTPELNQARFGNVYLHYVFDLWVQHRRKHRATGEVIVVRYADDSVLGFQYRAEIKSRSSR